MKLNQDDVDRLRDAYHEFNQVKGPIVRETDAGERIVLTGVEDIAHWGGGRAAVIAQRGISKGRFYELRNNGWKLKRGIDPNDVVEEPNRDGDHVAGDAFRALYQSSLEEIGRRDRRIVELETEVSALRKQLEER